MLSLLKQGNSLQLAPVSKLVDIALKYDGFPSVRYVQPGTHGNTPKAFDCSGFVQWVILESGISVPKVPNTDRIIRHSEEFFDFLGFLIHKPAVQPGDLVFFSKNGCRPSHLGIYIGEGNMIHSPGMDGKKVVVRSVEDFCKKNRLRFKPKEESVQIYFDNPIGYKRVTSPSGVRYQTTFVI